jgi:hypothetical protein
MTGSVLIVGIIGQALSKRTATASEQARLIFQKPLSQHR